MFSRYNFTDIKEPYNGVDGYGVAKLSWWIDSAHRLGPYVQAVPVVCTEDEFWWQRNVEFDVGVQWYPFKDPNGKVYEPLQAIRFFVMASRRVFYDQPGGVKPVKRDAPVGVDYYYDNLFTPDKLACFVFSTATYRPTNFSLDDYHGFVWSGNVKVGPKLCLGGAFVVPYGVVDWTWSPRYPERWFENFVRAGGGVRVYPWGDKPDKYPCYLAYDLARRFHIFAEVVQNVAWLGESAPSGVHGTDVRVGIAFSTGGFFAEQRRK